MANILSNLTQGSGIARAPAWIAQQDPLTAFIILAVILAVLAAIPATSGFAVWAAAAILFLLLIVPLKGSTP